MKNKKKGRKKCVALERSLRDLRKIINEQLHMSIHKMTSSTTANLEINNNFLTSRNKTKYYSTGVQKVIK